MTTGCSTILIIHALQQHEISHGCIIEKYLSFLTHKNLLSFSECSVQDTYYMIMICIDMISIDFIDTLTYILSCAVLQWSSEALMFRSRFWASAKEQPSRHRRQAGMSGNRPKQAIFLAPSSILWNQFAKCWIASGHVITFWHVSSFFCLMLTST